MRMYVYLITPDSRVILVPEEQPMSFNYTLPLPSPQKLHTNTPHQQPYNSISLLNTSLPSSTTPRPEILNTSVYLLPSFTYIPFLPRLSFSSVQALVKAHLLPKKLHPAHDALSPIHRDRLLRKPDEGRALYGVRDVKDVMVLICGHGGRDARCGIYGPLLRMEFENSLEKQGFSLARNPIVIPGPAEVAQKEEEVDEIPGKSARVGLISHIGGHKFAGNVIIYLPPGMVTRGGEPHPLAGCGIWYGRVEPKHVEGIVGETVREGRVIEELFRGGVRRGGEVLRI